ncbi:Retrovirus-related Pol polyprotein from transposon [Trichinella sp. T6]|nr:Retrovirus-related Pol polyprotein from transposon [Trichinella sp. T6]
MLALVWVTRHFRPYLYGRKFTARTDHNELRWLRNFREPEGQVARWLERLAEYEFEVVHRPGQQHRNADALSRRV